MVTKETQTSPPPSCKLPMFLERIQLVDIQQENILWTGEIHLEWAGFSVNSWTFISHYGCGPLVFLNDNETMDDDKYIELCTWYLMPELLRIHRTVGTKIVLAENATLEYKFNEKSRLFLKLANIPVMYMTSDESHSMNPICFLERFLNDAMKRIQGKAEPNTALFFSQIQEVWNGIDGLLIQRLTKAFGDVIMLELKRVRTGTH